MGCTSLWVPESSHACATLRTDSVVAQKYDGLSFHPICRACGITRRVGVPGADGMTYAKFQSATGWTTIRQYLSARSIFEKWMCSLTGTSTMKSSRRGKTLPSSYTGTSGASRTVLSLTDSWRMMSSLRARFLPRDWPRRTAKERSKIMRLRRLR
jgi:hypothetical protein